MAESAFAASIVATPGFVKICGVTSERDAELVVSAGASALGVILAPSPRHVSPERAREMTDQVRGAIRIVAVVREMDDEAVLRALDVVQPDIVQLHDAVSHDLLSALRERGLFVVKALATGSDDFASFDDSSVDAVLVDGPRPGSGVTHSWTDLGQRTFRVPVIAAGGLTPDNVVAAIVETSAFGVDTASGVESAPGVKDPTLVANFVAAARRAYQQRGEL